MADSMRVVMQLIEAEITASASALKLLYAGNAVSGPVSITTGMAKLIIHDDYSYGTLGKLQFKKHISYKQFMC